MPETDLPVDLPAPFVTFGPAGAVVIGFLATYGAVSLSFDATHKFAQVKNSWKVRRAEKKAVAANNTPTK